MWEMKGNWVGEREWVDRRR